MKIIQDINDMQKFQIQDFLPCLEYAHNPNGEDINKIKRYNQVIIDLYKSKAQTTVEDFFQMWLALEIGEELGLKVKAKTEEFLKDIKLIKKIELIYNDIIENYKDLL